MDKFARLERAQQVLELMDGHGLCSVDAAEDRLLADCLVALTQDARNAENLQTRWNVLLKRLPQIPMALVQQLGPQTAEAVVWPSQPLRVPGSKGESARGEKRSGSNEGEFAQKREMYEEKRDGFTPDVMVGLKAMERARSTLEDFYSSYLMFHGFEATSPQDVFQHLPILAFVEAFIYQLDEQNEETLLPRYAKRPRSHMVQTPRPSQPPSRAPAMGRQAPVSHKGQDFSQEGIRTHNSQEALQKPWKAVVQTLPAEQSPGPAVTEEAFGGLIRELQIRKLLTDRIQQELHSGISFWRLEQSLCRSVLEKEQISREDVLKALRLKSFDYRVLNLLLYQLRQQPVNETHFQFLALSEILVEIGDDLFDYEEDVVSNAFNVLRMFVALYGPQKGPTELAKYITEVESDYEALLAELEPSLAVKYRERCKEATRQGGGAGPTRPMGAWTIPAAIVDEEGYRRQVLSTHLVSNQQKF